MARTIDTSLHLFSHYFPAEVKIRVLDEFLFIEAETKEGIKGVNFTTHKFKSCRKLRKNIDIDKLKAFYSPNSIRITSTGTRSYDEMEIIIDKRQARRMKQAPYPKFDPKKQETYEKFVHALKEIGMIR